MPKIQIPYPGGTGLAKQIISFLPREGRVYLEPFAGRANLFREAVGQGLQYRRWWLNDIATPMEAATEMAGLVLELRDSSQNAKLKQRLELLAEHFLRITRQKKEAEAIARMEIANGRSGSTETLTM